MNRRRGPVARVMANVASEARAAFVRAFFVTFVLTLALVPWQHAGPQQVVVSLEPVRRPPVIVAMELYREPSRGLIGTLVDALAGPPLGVVPTPEHGDAQAWPGGMVIAPPPFPPVLDRMETDVPSALDSMLSGLLVPWLSLGS